MSLIQSFLFSVALSSTFTYAAPHAGGGLLGGSLLGGDDTPDKQDGGLLGGVGDLVGDTLDGVGDAVNGLLPSLTSKLELATATALTPSAVSDAASRISSVVQAEATGATIVDIGADLIDAALTTDNVGDITDYLAGLAEGENSSNNNNPRNPQPAAYPKAQRNDAPYSLSEKTLRGAIYIPPTFQYGRKDAPQPIILVPGTGSTGYLTYKGNYIPLLQGSTIGDPVWLNIPQYLLGDAQVNAEFVAYAINYIYGISNHRKPAIFSWSQGGIDAQWAFKYWPSTRSRVTDLVAFSPDFHGTVIADLISLGEPLPPSLFQQQYNSNFITTLRANGGDSAYVPTTTIYSGFFDEIVEPQQGRGASAYLLDARNKGVTNNEVQAVCPDGSAGGSFYTHEGVLYHPLGYALAVDALQHEGPGRRSRINVAQVCAPYLTPGLDLADFLITENVIPIAAASILAYDAINPTVFNEPPIKRYAQRRA